MNKFSLLVFSFLLIMGYDTIATTNYYHNGTIVGESYKKIIGANHAKQAQYFVKVKIEGKVVDVRGSKQMLASLEVGDRVVFSEETTALSKTTFLQFEHKAKKLTH